MSTLYPVALVLHVLAAMIWVGGVLFFAVVAVPVSRALPPELRRDVVTRLGERFRPVGWAALAVLVATGLIFLWRWGASPANLLDLSFFSTPHTRLLGYKLLAVTTMLPLSFVHDWALGPRASRATPGSEEAERLRRVASLMGRTTGALVLVIVLLAVFIARPSLLA